MTKYKAILMFGAPGSGKGTQSKVLAALPGFLHTSTGDLFRALDPNSEMGRLFQQYSSRGELVPDSFTIDLWKNHMKTLVTSGRFNPAGDIVIMDGVPRNVAQARLLDDSIDVVKIIYLAVSDNSKMVDRLKKRAMKEGRRDDADEKVIRNRLEVYEKNTAPILSHYPADRTAKVDALLSMLGVLGEIVRIVRPIREQLDAA